MPHKRDREPIGATHSGSPGSTGRVSAAQDDSSRGTPAVQNVDKDGHSTPPLASKLAPLSFVEERLWFFDQLVPGCPAYNSFRALRLSGPLDQSALEHALAGLVERHAALRTTFQPLDGSLAQVVHPAGPVPLAVHDLSALDGDDQVAAVTECVVAEARRPFDLGRDLLLRASLLRLATTGHVLVLVTHHIVFDAWSAGVLLRDFAALYDAACSGEPAALADLPMTYVDFAVWQRERMDDQRIAADLAYWTEQFSRGLPVLQLPTDRLRPPVQTFAGARRTVHVSAGLVGALKALCRRERATLYMTMLAAYQALLARYTGQEQIVVGSPIAGRTRVETEGLVGCFINTLTIPANLSGDPTFRELLGRVRAQVLGAFAHQEMPFERLVEALQPERDLARTPVFQTMFQLRNIPRKPLRSAMLDIQELEVDPGIAKFDLTLEVTERQGGADVSCEYNTDLFTGETIDRFLEHYRILLAGIVADPDTPLSRLPLLSPAERARVLVEWNATARDIPRERSVHQLVEEQVARCPDAVAVRDGDREMTYAELNGAANRLAYRLRAAGVGPEVRVGVCMERSLEFVVSALAILKAGGAYVPLDPSHPQARLAFMLQDAGAPVLLTLGGLREQVTALLGGSTALVIYVDELDDALPPEASDTLPCLSTGESLAYIMYTSGSTGQPKGVAVVHRNIVRLVVNTDYIQLGPDDVVAFASNCSFDAATFELWGALVSGARLVVVPREVTLAPEELVAYLRAEQIGVLFLTTALFNAVARAVPDGFRSLRYVLFGGEAVDPRPVRLVLKHGAPARLLHVYGPTETTTYATWHLVREAPPTATTIPIGRPIANTTAYVLDRHGQPAPIGVPGELYIGGDGVVRGYFNRSELTAERFVLDLFSAQPGARLYRTGDLVRWLADGSIEFLGRVDDQVKIRGFRIEPGEIEAALSEHPAVEQAAVLVRQERGGEKRLVAYIVSAAGPVPSARALREHLIQRVPDYMVPTAFVALDALPVTPNGKVDRAALPAPMWSASEAETWAAPRSATEEALAQIWAEILVLERVSIADNFFALGGHSLLATQVVSRMRESLGVRLPLRAVFEAPTIATLAERVEVARREREDAVGMRITTASRDSHPPLSFMLERFWFLEQLTPGHATYNVPIALRLTGSLDVAALERSLTEIVRRHEALRTTFAVVDGAPVQRIAPPGPVSLPVADLSPVPIDMRLEEAFRLARREFERPCDLAVGPLFRAQLLRLNAQDYILVVTIHHSVFDGWSMGIFARELQALYTAFSAGQPSPLPDLPLQYADYAVWQRTQVAGPALAPSIKYWRDQLAGAPPLLQLPTDRPRPATRAFRGGRHPFLIAADLADRLGELGRREGATLYMTLLAAFQTMLGRYSGEDDLLVGSPIAGRTQLEVENLIGCFLDTLVLRGDLSGDPTFRELLGRVREVTLGAYAHQELPFEHLLELLQPARETSYSPLVQVLFILQNTPRRALDLPGLAIEPLDIDNGTTKFDLTLELTETPEGLRGSLQYDTDLFEAGTIARMAAHFQTLLAALVAGPDQPISRLPLLPPEERQLVLVGWNETASPYPEDTSLVALFEAQAGRMPDAVAFTCGGQMLTYADLNFRANQLARYLRRRGVGPEVLVGVCLERSFDLAVTLLAIFKAGGAYMPLDPSYPAERLAHMLADSRAALVIGTEHVLTPFAAGDAGIVALSQEGADIAAESPENLGNDVAPTAPDALAYVLYTSGSTGQPKGVAIPHRQLLNRFAWMWQRYPFAPGEVGCQKTSINFVDSLWEIFGPLLRGVRSVIVPERELRDPSRFLATLAAERVTRLWLVPSFLRALLESYPDLARRVPDLTFWAIGGEALSLDLYQRFRAAMPGCTLVNIYGASEFFDATYFDCQAEPEESYVVPIGRPLANMRAYMLDAHGEPTPIGVSGDLYIGGVGLARGYLHRPELTAERFVPDPFGDDPHTRLYRTGDRARWRADGQLEYLGRGDRQVKVRGYRIELREIEATLAQHPSVRQYVVVVREDAAGERQIVGYAVLNEVQEGGEPTSSPADLRHFLETRLPAYMVPAAVVILPSLPLTPSGKVDRLALPAPERARPEEAAHAGARTETERTLVAIWERLLGVASIGIDENYFDLGGHSLLAVRLFAQIEAAFGVNLPLSVLLQAPTIAQLAAVLEGDRGASASSSLVAIHPHGSRPPLFFVHAIGGGVLGYKALARHLDPDQPLYGFQARGTHGDAEPSTSIAEMAAQYIAEMRALQPTGSYYLAGLSGGGVIAFEMAQQLYERGERVALLGIFDTSVKSSIPDAPDSQYRRLALRVLSDMPGYLVDYLTQRTMGQRIKSARSLLKVLRRKLVQMLPTNRGGTTSHVTAMLFESWMQDRVTEVPEYLGSVLRAHVAALRAYEPRYYPGDVVVFRAISQRLFSPHFRDLGWGKVARRVTVQPVPGNHATFIQEPQVHVLADRLSVCLLEAQAAEATSCPAAREAQPIGDEHSE